MCPHVCDAPQAPEQLSFQTIGGTDVRVGRTTLGDTGAPGPHVSLRVGHTPKPGRSTGARALFVVLAVVSDLDGGKGRASWPRRCEVAVWPCGPARLRG